MGHPFPLHQLLHCIRVDYWSDWVAFVSPRVFLFHCLFPPETSGKEKKKRKPHQLSLSLYLLLPLDRNWLHRERVACSIPSHGWVQTQRALLEKDTDTSKFLLQASGSKDRALAHSPGAALPFPSHKGQRVSAPNGQVPFSQSVTTDSGLQEFSPQGPLPARQQFPDLCSLAGDKHYISKCHHPVRTAALSVLCCGQMPHACPHSHTRT